MPKYCDSKVLERNWFHWLLSSSVPDLEPYRQLGILWTKVDAEQPVRSKRKKPLLPNPRHPDRLHCIALPNPVYFSSKDGAIYENAATVLAGEPNTSFPPENLSLLFDNVCYDWENIFKQQIEIVPQLESQGYVLEIPTEISWHAMLDDINKMCQGIAVRFKQPSEEEQLELANEALLQVTNKLVSYKLVYTPGLAPVFNLLTTTIHRCMYSIMNRRKTQRLGMQKFVDQVQSGSLPQFKQPRRPIRT
ncbi:hypothetical protein N9045_01915 [bacterium]|nr:hypothetical protein [bacterium]